MRYEQLKSGDIFDDLFGTYIKTDFGAAGILQNTEVEWCMPLRMVQLHGQQN